MSLDAVVNKLKNLETNTRIFTKKTKDTIQAIYDSELLFLTASFENDKERMYGLWLAIIHYKARTTDNPFYETFLHSFQVKEN